MNRRLLRRFLELYPFQPATAVWRAAEVAELGVLDSLTGRGLDLGCGDGRLTRVVNEEWGPLRLTGLDIDPMETALAQAERLYERVHTSPAGTIPEPDASFDFVISISVMEHIPQLEPVLAEVCRVLKTGGRLIATVPGVGFHRCLRGPMLPGSSRSAYLSALDRRVAHLRYWTIDQWKTALDRAGLRLNEGRPIMTRADVRRWETISRVTAGLLHAMSRGKKAPIEIQRSLGLRRSGQRLPVVVAAALTRLLAAGLDGGHPPSEHESGCVLVIATRH